MDWMKYLSIAVVVLVGAGCSTFKTTPMTRPPLAATACKPTSASQANQAGSALYNQRRWEAAKAKFEEAVTEGPKCAEAHYNLGLALTNLGAKDEARNHFLEAADLAPGNQVIWDSPALRPYGEPQKEVKKKDKSGTAAEQAPGAFGNRGRLGGY